MAHHRLHPDLRCICAAAALGLLLASAGAAQAQAQAQRLNPSAALSGLSLLPVAVVASATGLMLSAGATFAVVAVEKTADGSVWLLQRGADGARVSLHLAGGASVAVGTAVVVGAVATGWVLSAAGQAVAFVPNQIGAALLYNERVSR